MRFCHNVLGRKVCNGDVTMNLKGGIHTMHAMPKSP